MNHQEKVNELTEKISEINKEILKVLNDYAEKNCPYKIGDTVEIIGYSHIGKKGVINRITGVTGWETIKWKVFGKVLKKMALKE